MPDHRQLPLTFAFAIWAALSLFVAVYGAWLGYGGRPFTVAVGAFALLLAGQVFAAARGASEALLNWVGERGAVAASLLPAAVYVAYAAGAGAWNWKWIAFGLVYTLLPAALLFPARNAKPGSWLDYAAVLALWMPVELRRLYALWPCPRELTHTLTILLALNTGIVAFLLLRRLDGVGYSVEWGRGFGWNVALHFLVFAAIAIPLGEAIGFISFDPSLPRLRSLPIAALGILFFTAWPEEFLFRGLLQNLLARTLRSPLAGLLAASVIFGFAHINNGGFPNWRYVLLATIAGLFYGRTWMKTGSLFAPCLVHALVDISWHALFR